MTLLTGLVALACVLGLSRSRPALAFSASGPLLANGTGTGTGSATTTSGPSATVQVSLQNATPAAIYAIYSCLALTGGDFDCTGKNNPPALQTVAVAPKALAPISVNLVQQGTVQTDSSGNGNATIFLTPQLLPDTPHSIYNVVQLINLNNPTDSFTALDLQAPAQPVVGVLNIPAVTVTTVIGVPVYVLAPFPGYAFPVAITTLNGAPFVPSITIPQTVIGGPPLNFIVGRCPNGLPARLQPTFFGQIIILC